MSLPITFQVFGDPKPQPRPRAFTRKLNDGRVVVRAYEAGTAEHWKTAIALAAKPYVPMPPLQGPLSVSITFCFQRPKSHFCKFGLKGSAPEWHSIRPDRDNLEKAVLDALSQISMWDDDCQVCDGRVSKKYCGPGERPCAVVTIESLNSEHARVT